MKTNSTVKIIILLSIIIMAMSICIICLYYKMRQQRKLVQNTTIVLEQLKDAVKNDIDETLGDYELLYSLINDHIDSFVVYSNIEPVYNSPEFKQYFSKITDYDWALFQNFSTYSNEIKLFKSLIDYVFLCRLQRSEIENYALFDGVGVNVNTSKDTINLGDEYSAIVEYSATFSETIPTMVIDGDTIPCTRIWQNFKETPSEKGNVKHDCMITFNWQGHILELPFTIEYYVK